MEHVLLKLLTFRQQVQLFHWSTMSYAKHVASNTLYNNISTLIDKFVETLQGRMNERISYKKLSLKLKNVSDKKIDKVLVTFREFLSGELEEKIDSVGKDNTDLKNIRDEMISEVNQALYLFSLH